MMRVENNNLVYDDDLEGCDIELCSCQGQLFAFVQLLDIGPAHCRFKVAQSKRYWGFWSHDNAEGSLLNIIKTGGKWPVLEVL